MVGGLLLPLGARTAFAEEVFFLGEGVVAGYFSNIAFCYLFPHLPLADFHNQLFLTITVYVLLLANRVLTPPINE